MGANFSQLTFQWSSVSSCCPAIRYLIVASNCGHCPNVTNLTTATCTGLSVEGQQCNFAVRSIVCDDVIGNESKNVSAILRGMPVIIAICQHIELNQILCMIFAYTVPRSPTDVSVVPTYSYETKALSAITTKFNGSNVSSIANYRYRLHLHKSCYHGFSYYYNYYRNYIISLMGSVVMLNHTQSPTLIPPRVLSVPLLKYQPQPVLTMSASTHWMMCRH